MAKKDKYLNPEPIDPRTDYGKGIFYKWGGKEFENMEEVRQYIEMYYDNMKKKEKYLNPEPIDPRTDSGKGIYYKACDGKYFETMEDVRQHNDNMMKKNKSRNR
ncbi:MAG: hypothetical protein VZS44_00725 [Bacilli bacterium]|nr:hypothetical protein [Bacilli bacterium]